MVSIVRGGCGGRRRCCNGWHRGQIPACGSSSELLSFGNGRRFERLEPDWFPKKELTTVGVYYYPEAWPASRWARDMENIHKLGMEFVHMGEFAWYFMEPEEGQFHFEWLDRSI